LISTFFFIYFGGETIFFPKNLHNKREKKNMHIYIRREERKKKRKEVERRAICFWDNVPAARKHTQESLHHPKKRRKNLFPIN
jgi:hypothetical protein